MKKGYKILALFLLGLFAVSLISGIVAALNVSSFTDSLTNLTNASGIGDFLGKLISPSILFAVLIFLVIYTVASQVPFISGASNGIKIAISVVIAILSAAFISPDVIRPLINQYSAIGIAVSFVLPFILMFYFIKSTFPQNSILQKAVWVIYFIALFISYISNANELTTSLAKWIYWIMFILTGIMFFWGKSIYNMLWKEELKEAEAKGMQTQKTLTASKIISLEESLRNLNVSPGNRTKIEAEIARLKEQLG